MRDYNFFEVFSKEKKRDEFKFIYVGGLTIIIVVAMVSVYLVSVFKIKGIEADITSMETTINSGKFSLALKEKSLGEKKLDVLNRYVASINIINSAVSNEDYINTELIKTISNVVPQNISFQNISIANKIITMSGTSSTRVAIGELEYNLKKLEKFEDIHVSSMSASSEDIANSSFKFNLTFKLKEDSSNENQ